MTFQSKCQAFLLLKEKHSIVKLFSPPSYAADAFQLICKTAKDGIINNVTAAPYDYFSVGNKLFKKLCHTVVLLALF